MENPTWKKSDKPSIADMVDKAHYLLSKVKPKYLILESDNFTNIGRLEYKISDIEINGRTKKIMYIPSLVLDYSQRMNVAVVRDFLRSLASIIEDNNIDKLIWHSVDDDYLLNSLYAKRDFIKKSDGKIGDFEADAEEFIQYAVDKAKYKRKNTK